MANVEWLLTEMVQHGLRYIAFCKMRKLCEQVLAHTCEVLEETMTVPKMVASICMVLGGYVANKQWQIEADLFSGRLCGVVATNLLELGIDVNHVDTTLHLVFRSSIASLWQQAGVQPAIKGLHGCLCCLHRRTGPDFMNYPNKLFNKP